MSEAELDLILDAVSTALAQTADERFLVASGSFHHAIAAANDNDLAWPLLPFPEGWYAAC